MAPRTRALTALAAVCAAVALWFVFSSTEVDEKGRRAAPNADDPLAPLPRNETPRDASPEATQTAPEPGSQSAQPPKAEQAVKPESEPQFWRRLEELERGNKEQALRYALLGEDWYSDEGKPAEARRAKIVTLLVDLGRMDEARERTRAFIDRYPKSPYRPLIQGQTGIHPRPGRPPTDGRTPL